jgi:hypothetical protein
MRYKYEGDGRARAKVRAPGVAGASCCHDKLASRLSDPRREERGPTSSSSSQCQRCLSVPRPLQSRVRARSCLSLSPSLPPSLCLSVCPSPSVARTVIVATASPRHPCAPSRDWHWKGPRRPDPTPAAAEEPKEELWT